MRRVDGGAQVVGVNCTPKLSEPGVSMPPDAITLTTSTPRRACSATAARRPRPARPRPPRKWQCPPGVVSGGPAATIRGRPGLARSRRVQGPEADVAEVAHGGHPGRHLSVQRLGRSPRRRGLVVGGRRAPARRWWRPQTRCTWQSTGPGSRRAVVRRDARAVRRQARSAARARRPRSCRRRDEHGRAAVQEPLRRRTRRAARSACTQSRARTQVSVFGPIDLAAYPGLLPRSKRCSVMPAAPESVFSRLEPLLPTVSKPIQYVGGELNSTVKDWDCGARRRGETVRWALMYPDAYEVGLPNQGVQILYEVLNERDWIVAERTYSVWPDLEAVMRAGDAQGPIPQFTVDGHRPVGAFDVFGLSFSTELGYTNMLNALDLAGIPLHAVDRGDDDPIVLAGGHAAFNPEPIAAFLDAAVLGDGEEVVLAISEVVREWKGEGAPRRAGRAAAAPRRDRQRLRPALLRRHVRRRRHHRGGRAEQAGHPLPGAQAHADGPRRVALPGQAPGPARRDRARAVLRRDLPRLHPRLPLLPGRDDHPAGARAVDRDHRRDGRDRRPRLGLRGGRAAVAVERRPHRDRRGRQGPGRPLRGHRTSRCRCPRPASTPSTSRWPTSSRATAGARG